MSRKTHDNGISQVGGIAALQSVSATRLELSSSPLPTADEFAKYDVALPGAAERILAMAERQSAHRQSLEKSAVEEKAKLDAEIQRQAFETKQADIAKEKRGQNYALALAVLMFSAVVYAMYLGREVFASIGSIAFVAYVIAAFIQPRNK